MDALSAATRAAADAAGTLTRLSARRCKGVQTTCMSGGETSCETTPAADSRHAARA